MESKICQSNGTQILASWPLGPKLVLLHFKYTWLLTTRNKWSWYGYVDYILHQLNHDYFDRGPRFWICKPYNYYFGHFRSMLSALWNNLISGLHALLAYCFIGWKHGCQNAYVMYNPMMFVRSFHLVSSWVCSKCIWNRWTWYDR